MVVSKEALIVTIKRRKPRHRTMLGCVKLVVEARGVCVGDVTQWLEAN